MTVLPNKLPEIDVCLPLTDDVGDYSNCHFFLYYNFLKKSVKQYVTSQTYSINALQNVQYSK